MYLFELSNPLDLPGPRFLLLYLVVFSIAVVVSLILRRRLRSPHDEPMMQGPALDLYETAYLTSDRFPVDAVIGMLVKREVINVNAQTCTLSVKSSLPENSHSFEQAAHAAMAGSPTINYLRKALAPQVAALGTRPKARGLVLSDEQAYVARIVPALVILMVAAFGALKILVGIMRDRPVTFLVVFCIMTSFIAYRFFKAAPRLTGAGEKYLRNLRQQKAALETTARTRPNHLSGPDLALAMGLFGLGALGAGYGPIEDIKTAMRSQAASGGSASSWSANNCSSGSSSCSSGSSSCSSSSCGGGSGCGGCGSWSSHSR